MNRFKLKKARQNALMARRFGMGTVALTLLLTLITGCGGGGGAGSSSSKIVFSSDRSVILPKAGSTYQFQAGIQSGSGMITPASFTWTSSNPSVVSVDGSGKVTALASSGSAAITVSAPGVPAETADVIIAQPASQTILVNSSDVLSHTQGEAILASNATTTQIKPGDIVVSGDKGGLLDQVTSVQPSGANIAIGLNPCSLPQAFQNLDIDLTGAPVQMRMQMSRGRAVLSTMDGRVVGVFRGNGFNCTDNTGATVNVNLSGPSFTFNVTANLVLKLQSHWTLWTGPQVTLFELAVNLVAPVGMTTGSASFLANGTAGFTCSETLGSLDIPAVCVGPIDFSGSLVPSAGIKVSLSATGSLTVSGPSLNDTLSALDGVQWTPSAGWQTIGHNSQSGLSVTPAGIKFTTALSGDIFPYLRLDVGFNADLDDVLTLAGVKLAYAQDAGKFGLSFSSPLSYQQSGYSGPIWNAGLEVSAGPELQISGELATLLKQLGLPTNFGEWALYDQTIPFANSPNPALSSNSSSVNVGSPVNLTATIPNSNLYQGDDLQFWAYPSYGTPAEIADAKVNGSPVNVTWTPSATGPAGSCQVKALLFDNTFGSLGFPYASSPPLNLTVQTNTGANITIN